MKRCLLSMFLISAVSIVVAQTLPDIVKRYNGPANKNDAVRAMVTDANGNIYITGYSDTRNSALDYVIIKYSPAGQQLWASTYNGTGNGEDWANAIAVDAAGNVYVTGRSTGIGTNFDYATVKYNASGEQIWAKRYNSPSNLFDIAKDVKVDGLGNVYVTGFSDGASQFNGNKITTIKYDNMGALVWQTDFDVAPNIYDGSFHGKEEGQSLALDVSGNCYVTGVSINNQQQYKAITIKYAASGNLVWSTIGLGEQGRKVIIASDGNILTANWGGVTSKYDAATGVVLWDVTGPGNAAYYDMASDQSGNVYVTGYGRLNSSSDDYITIKYNSVGSQQWVRTYNGSNNGIDISRSIATDNSGNIYVTGRAEMKSGRTAVVNIATIKYDNAGNQIGPTLLYDGPEKKGSDAFAVCVDISGNIWVSGSVTGKNLDCLTIRYPASGAREGLFNEVPNAGSIIKLKNYPNPIITSTTIEFQLQEAGQIELAVFDLNGKRISSIINAYRNAGIHRVTYHPNRVTAGTYIVQLKQGKITQQLALSIVR